MLNVDQFIADCRAALRDPAPVPAIKHILERVVSRPAEVEAALGTPREGGVKTIHHDRELTIFNVVWAPGMVIHPHNHLMWALIGLYGGREDNVFYRRGVQGLETAGGRELNTGDTTLLGESIIHSVANPLRVFTGAIHIYGGDFFGTPRSEWDPDTLQERPWDMENTRKAFEAANERWRAECTRR